MMTRTDLARHLPHAGRMILIDEVLSCHDQSLQAVAHDPHHPDNPLNTPEGLGVACLIEYAAQAMALHAGWQRMDREPVSGHGVLASLRQLRWHVLQVPAQATRLQIDVDWLSGDARTAMYQFRVAGAGLALVSGQAMVVLTQAPGTEALS